MASDMEKPRVTEIKVRMDCNGCVQKIKKSLQGVPGIHDIYVDFPEQKVTITGWAEPEKLVKAIKKTRKSAVICVHTEESEPPPEADTPPEEEAPPPEPADPRAEPPQTEAAPPPEQPQQENPPPASGQHHYHPQRPNNLEEVHIVYHHPPQRGYGGPWNEYQAGPGFRNEEPYQPPQFVYASPGPHANPYRPSPVVSPAPHVNTYRPSLHVSPGFRDEEPYQPSQPMYMGSGQHAGPGFRDGPARPAYATHSYNTYNPSPYVTGYAHPPSPPKYPANNSADTSSGPELRDEGEPSQPVYATKRHRYNVYRPSPYVSEYAYPESPPRYSSHSYSRDYYSGNYEHGNVSSMFSEENPNACRIV